MSELVVKSMVVLLTEERLTDREKKVFGESWTESTYRLPESYQSLPYTTLDKSEYFYVSDDDDGDDDDCRAAVTMWETPQPHSNDFFITTFTSEFKLAAADPTLPKVLLGDCRPEAWRYLHELEEKCAKICRIIKYYDRASQRHVRKELKTPRCRDFFAGVYIEGDESQAYLGIEADTSDPTYGVCYDNENKRYMDFHKLALKRWGKYTESETMK